MAKIIVGGKDAEVADGSNIQSAAESLGIPFSCKEGVCGSCLCKVVKGKENLSSMTGAEKDYGLDESGSKRLACQCKAKGGEVELESSY